MTSAAESEVRYSVVVPIYRNRESLPELVERLVHLNAQRGGAIEAVFVVDGSPDDSLEVLRVALSNEKLAAQVMSHSRNFGSIAAVRSGLRAARGEFIGVMAADLQEPAEVVEAFFDALDSGDYDIVVGERTGRDDPAMSSLAARMYWRIYQRFINADIPTGGVDVFGCTRAIAERIVSFQEAHTSLVGLLYWLGYRRLTIPYRRAARHSGTSAWTMRRKLRYLFDSVYAFTDLPIVLLQVLGLIGVIVSVVVGVVVFVGWLAGAVKEPGYTPLMIAIAGATSAILLALGVVGSYVWRTYENSKQRPQELVASHEFFDA